MVSFLSLSKVFVPTGTPSCALGAPFLGTLLLLGTPLFADLSVAGRAELLVSPRTTSWLQALQLARASL